MARRTLWLNTFLTKTTLGRSLPAGIACRADGQRFATRRQPLDEVIDWMTFYNHRSIHSTLGYVSPMQFERSWLAAQLSKAT